ncbi:MAG: coenzyme-B sulfoethylthiotransferase subunit gamma [Candidatus Methanomethylicaceae archaeon]
MAENRRRYLNPDHKLKRIRKLSDEALTRLLGFRSLVRATNPSSPRRVGIARLSDQKNGRTYSGCKSGDMIRFIQLTDSIYFAPIMSTTRGRLYHWRIRGYQVFTKTQKA